MGSTATRTSAIVYLAAVLLTSLPISVGLLGWCPCGCIPDAIVSAPINKDDSSKPTPAQEDHHDSHQCRGCNGLPYCPMLAEPPQVEWADAGQLVIESTDLLPPSHFVRLIRPPRA
jgi:hypothetical protein